MDRRTAFWSLYRVRIPCSAVKWTLVVGEVRREDSEERSIIYAWSKSIQNVFQENGFYSEKSVIVHLCQVYKMLLTALRFRLSVNRYMFAINRPWPFWLPEVHLREKRPSLVEKSDWKMTKRTEPDDLIVDLGTVQNLPSNGELVLEPSYSVTLSKRQLPVASIDNSSNSADITYNVSSKVSAFYIFPENNVSLTNTTLLQNTKNLENPA